MLCQKAAYNIIENYQKDINDETKIGDINDDNKMKLNEKIKEVEKVEPMEITKDLIFKFLGQPKFPNKSLYTTTPPGKETVLL